MPRQLKTYRTGDLPIKTRQYLFELIINGKASSEPKEELKYDNPDGVPGKTVKYGGEKGEAPGTATFSDGKSSLRLRKPGKFRLVKHMQRGDSQMVKWFYAEHFGADSNTYKYCEIILPDCPTCHGYSRVDCDKCQGVGVKSLTQRIVDSGTQLSDMRRCDKCKGTGMMQCPTCWPQGVNTPRKSLGPGGPFTISLDRNRWDNF